MRVRWWIVLGILIPMPPLVARSQEEIKVRGRVVDTAGKPVAGAEVALIWMSAENEMKPYLGVTANAEGRFTLPVTFRSRKRRLRRWRRVPWWEFVTECTTRRVVVYAVVLSRIAEIGSL